MLIRFFSKVGQTDLTEEDTLVFNLDVDCVEDPNKKGHYLNEEGW